MSPMICAAHNCDAWFEPQANGVQIYCSSRCKSRALAKRRREKVKQVAVDAAAVRAHTDRVLSERLLYLERCELDRVRPERAMGSGEG